MKRIITLLSTLIFVLHSYSQDVLYDRIENTLIELHFGSNYDVAKQSYPSLEEECKNCSNDTIICYLNSLKAALLYLEENYEEAMPLLETEIAWKEQNALTRYHYLEDVFMLSQCYLMNDSTDQAERLLRRAIVNWTDESTLVTLSSSSGSFENFTLEFKELFFLAGFYITDVFQTLASVYIRQEKYTLVPFCYYHAQKYASILYSPEDERYYENLLLLIRTNIDLENYSRAKSYLIDYHNIPENLESYNAMKSLYEELQNIDKE